MLLMDDSKVGERRRACDGPLRPLLDSLISELDPLLGRELHVPRSKALLSRAGGRCERDGAVLEFDPASPHAHRCPACGTVHRGELHDRAWITFYQLWLAERAVHGALFNVLRPDARHARLARDVLRAYAESYLSYPNADNVLGPTRLFFSTYLESIWLLQICLAADLLETSGDSGTADLARDRIVEPSRALIAEYDEGMSNRQVWNNAALMAAAALCDDDSSFAARVDGSSGLVAHLEQALLSDGTWYEGENYHQFAMRGLWYAIVLAETRGHALSSRLVDRFARAFTAPYLTALPDFTMPSRKDSQYAVSLRQWRLAELTELGFARTGDPTLGMALGRSYESGHPRLPTWRSRSTADVERNAPAGSLTRADLGWRALLHALPELPDLPAGAPRSALLEGQGIAVFRRADDVYVGVDYGQSGGGHAHPDRLNLLLSKGSVRWLDDMGTGSYVDPSLHWYRSTLAHNAPLCDGASQELRDGVLRAHEEREGMGWIQAEFSDSGISFVRSVIVAPDYLIDELTWTAERPVRVELPLHLDARADCVMTPHTLDGGRRPSDGFSYVTGAGRADVPASRVVKLETARHGCTLTGFAFSRDPFTLFNAEGPGQPPASRRRFHVFRFDIADASTRRPASGTLRMVLAWTGDVRRVTFDEHYEIELRDGERHLHSRSVDGWHVELHAGGARSSIDLGRARSAVPRETPVAPARDPILLHRAASLPEWIAGAATGARTSLLAFDLGEEHYRRSEVAWKDAGRPSAMVAIAADDRSFAIYVAVVAGDPRFAGPNSTNIYDNEHADTMGAGVQLYLRTPLGRGAWMLVPESGGEAVRIRELEALPTLMAPRARWRPMSGGYELQILSALPNFADSAEYPVDVDVIVNETVSGRERRRGQLVLSGARGEFVYLRGDRHEADRMLPLVVVP